jgi:hypothetical protein
VDGEIVVERELARPFSVEQVGKPERWFALDSTLEEAGTFGPAVNGAADGAPAA